MKMPKPAHADKSRAKITINLFMVYLFNLNRRYIGSLFEDHSDTEL